jgi:phenylpyruvate tautomerase PptA (4-oxalocrotonate tautomerase family)
MPMIDVYSAAATFADPKGLAVELAATLKEIEGVPDIPLFRQNTAAFVHELPDTSIANVDGDTNYVRVQVLTNAGGLDRDKQVSVVERFVAIVTRAAGDEGLKDRIWVLLTEAAPGGWGVRGHAHTNDELVTAARDEITRLKGR